MDTGPGTHLELGAAVMRRGSCDDAAGALRPHLCSLAQRRRSAPSLGRALGIPWTPIREECSCWVVGEQCPFVLGLSSQNGELLLDECVQVTEGTRTRMRRLLLFTDSIVIAKLKSCSSYRLKHRVSLGALWLYGFEDEAEEAGGETDLRSSLVLAWPLALCVLSFRLPEVKQHWLDTLHRKIQEAKERAGCSSPAPDILMKVLTGSTATKTLLGGVMDPFISSVPDGDFKMAALPWQLCNPEERSRQPIEHGSSSKWSFRWKPKKIPRPDDEPQVQLFGRPLSLTPSEDGTLPKPITDLLVQLWRRGPSTEGVFRRTGNSRSLRSIREELSSGKEVDMETLPVVLLVGLLKSFLKELPGSLLVSGLYETWMRALDTGHAHLRLAALRRVVEQLPVAHLVLLRSLLCVLHRVGQSADANKMDAYNLAVCIAPTLLQVDTAPLDEQKEKVEKVTELTQFLIEHCCEIFGENIQNVLGDPDEYSSDSLQQHDSAYDSPDPDADGGDSVGSAQAEGGSSSPLLSSRAGHRSAVPSCSSDAIFTAFTQPAFSRRCSEPIIFHSAKMSGVRPPERSHDDSAEGTDFSERPLIKPISDDSFLLPGRGRAGAGPAPGLRKLGGSLNIESEAFAAGNHDSASKDSSSCSLESADSVFTSSPLASPACPRRGPPTTQGPLAPQPEALKADTEVKQRSQPMRADSKGLMRARSLGPFSFKRGSLRRENPPRERCGTLQEDSQSEADAPGQLSPRPRPLSAMEVFQLPPSYQQALQSAPQPATHNLGSMRVQDAARTLGRKSRPASMNDNFLSTYPFNQYTDCFSQVPEDGAATPGESLPPLRQRTMSESVSARRQETLSRRCSQPVFEEFSYAKESYV